MDLIVDGIIKAFWLLVSFDPEVLGITLLSIKISGTATLISLVIGISVGATVALTRFPGRSFVVSLINTGMALPPVVGLFVTISLWRNGPLGFLGILVSENLKYRMISPKTFNSARGRQESALNQSESKGGGLYNTIANGF
jgi:ABC-type tungstate transport system substrate-binding protein